MKVSNKNYNLQNLLILSLVLFVVSCKKENSSGAAAVTQTYSSISGAIAVALDSTSNDSVYVIGACANKHHLDSVSLTSLPANITDYLTANYAGYTFQKAFTDKDTSGDISGYVIIIKYNGNPVGLKFDASGNFIRVLEQREGPDISGRGWHEGGRFNDRDRLHRDTIALASLPQTILFYIAANYAQDTLIKAYKNRDGSYVVFSENNGAFATVFDASGSFIRRLELDPPHAGQVTSIDESSLPASVQSYVSATYPDYVFKAAFSLSENGTVEGYVVCIDANGTKYAVGFDASGNFIKAITIR